MFLKRLQLGLIHMAVAMTLVPINSTLNRVMIKDLGISASVVALLASLPYLFSPLQVAIGSFSDRHPLFGYRRTPYIILGLLLCVAGLAVSPQIAFLMSTNPLLGMFFATLAFGAWGMGYNFSSVSYLALASELSGEKERGKTIATMWFMMIVSIIFTAIVTSRLLEPYSAGALQNAFLLVSVAAFFIGMTGLIGLEKRYSFLQASSSESHYSIKQMASVIFKSQQAASFFWYLTLLLAAILGQDVLLEPFAAQAFGMSVQQTTRITSVWGGAVLLTILLAGALERFLLRKQVAQIGNISALVGLLTIMAGGLTMSQSAFWAGVVVLGCGTGIATVANLALMFDLTLPEYTGLFIGAWGVSNALSRLIGTMLAGILRDLFVYLTGEQVGAYLIVFGVEVFMLIVAVLMLVRIDVGSFHKQVAAPSVLERAATAD